MVHKLESKLKSDGPKATSISVADQSVALALNAMPTNNIVDKSSGALITFQTSDDDLGMGSVHVFAPQFIRLGSLTRQT